MQRAVDLFVSIALFACSACSAPASKPPVITGDYAPNLSLQDIQEIQFLISQRRDVRPSVAEIVCDERDHARVYCGRTHNRAIGSLVELVRKQGGWRVVSVAEAQHFVIRSH